MISILKIDVYRYGYPRCIQDQLSKELLQLFSLYFHWWGNKHISIWIENKIENRSKDARVIKSVH